jgi:hypothetical protein
MQLLVRYAELFTAFCPSAGYYCPAAGSSHTLTEAVFVSSFTIAGLKCPFHLALNFEGQR